MLDNAYRNAFKQVYYILENTEEELIQKIPKKFLNFIKDNMNAEYDVDIQKNVEIDKQNLLKETEAILALIYRSYWATDVEKQDYARRDKQELDKIEEEKRKNVKDINEIFEKRKDINKISLDSNLMVIEKENFIKKIIKKILKFFKK